MRETLLAAAVILVTVAATTGCSKDNKTTQPESPEAIDYPAAFVVLSGDNAIAVIDMETDQVERVIPLAGGSWPHHLNLSPDRATLSIGMPGMDLSAGHEGGMMGMKGQVVLMDAGTGKQRMSREMEAMVHNVIHSPNGEEIWTAMMMDSSSGMNAIHVYDRTMESHVAEIKVGSVPQEITFSMDGYYAFVCNGESNSASMIDVVTKTVVATIHVGDWPVGAWPGVDGLMYVDNEDSRSVSIIDPNQREVIATIDLGFVPGYVATPSSIGEIWVSDPDGAKVHYYDRATRDHIDAFDVGRGAHAIAFNVDASKAYVTNTADGTVSIVALATHTVAKTLPVGRKPNGIAVRIPNLAP